MQADARSPCPGELVDYGPAAPVVSRLVVGTAPGGHAVAETNIGCGARRKRV
jgi:hypothetical protein